MPAPKAVLADITDKGLSPDKPHRFIGADGRLKVKTLPDVSQDKVKSPSPPKPVPVIAPVPPAEESSDERLVEVPFETISDEQWQDVEEEISKPPKPGLESFGVFESAIPAPAVKAAKDKVVIAPKKKRVMPKRKTKKKAPVKRASRNPDTNEDS